MSHHYNYGNLSGGITLMFVGGAILATTVFGLDSSLVWKVGIGALLIVLGLLKLFNIGQDTCRCN